MPNASEYPYVTKPGAKLLTRSGVENIAAGTRLKLRGGNARSGFRRVELINGKKGIMRQSHFKKA